MWLYYPIKVALLVNLILLAFLLVFIKNGWEIYSRLYVNDAEAISGQFKDFAQYENMYDLDDNASGNRYGQGVNPIADSGIGGLARFVAQNALGGGGSPHRRERAGSDDQVTRNSASRNIGVIERGLPGAASQQQRA